MEVSNTGVNAELVEKLAAVGTRVMFDDVDSEVFKAKESAGRMLALRAKSRQGMKTALLRKGFSEPAVDTAVDDLTRAGLLNDHEYAVVYARYKVSKGVSSRVIRHDLAAEGVDDEAIDAAIGAVCTEESSEYDRALTFAQGRMKSLAAYPPEVQTRRLAGQLGRRGYGADVVLRVCAEVVGDDEGA